MLSVSLANVFLYLLFKRTFICAIIPFSCKESYWKQNLHIYEQQPLQFHHSLVIPTSISTADDISPPPNGLSPALGIQRVSVTLQVVNKV